MVTQLTHYTLNDSKSTVLNEFLNADREAKLIRTTGKLFHKLTTTVFHKIDVKKFLAAYCNINPSVTNFDKLCLKMLKRRRLVVFLV